MDEVSLPEVRRLVAAANAARRQRDASGGAAGPGAERRLDELFGTGHTLATYGTLVPGGPNHHVLAPLGGEWSEGLIEGDLIPLGWGTTLGYPGFRPRAGADAVAVSVLSAPSLAGAWPDLDRFEGPGYERILVPVFAAEQGQGQTDERLPYTVANLYAVVEAGPGGQPGPALGKERRSGTSRPALFQQSTRSKKPKGRSAEMLASYQADFSTALHFSTAS